MVHGENGITACDIVCAEYRIRGVWTDQVHAFFAQRFQYGDDGVDFLMTEVSTFAGMWIKSAHKYTRLLDIEV
jgi:hypothetical protein